MAAATEKADGLPHHPTGDLLSFLQQALKLLDENGTRPDLGARVQELIDELRESG